MNVELAEERILLLPDVLGAEQAESRAWAKRTDAFGAFAKLGGLLQQAEGRGLRGRLSRAAPAALLAPQRLDRPTSTNASASTG